MKLVDQNVTFGHIEMMTATHDGSVSLDVQELMHQSYYTKHITHFLETTFTYYCLTSLKYEPKTFYV